MHVYHITHVQLCILTNLVPLCSICTDCLKCSGLCKPCDYQQARQVSLCSFPAKRPWTVTLELWLVPKDVTQPGHSRHLNEGDVRSDSREVAAAPYSDYNFLTLPIYHHTASHLTYLKCTRR